MEFLKNNFRKIFILILIISVGVIWYYVFYLENQQNLLVTFFDVGQGDSEFIEIPGGNQILIDGGPTNAILAKLGRTLPFWDRSIDVLLLTHPHADHLDGLLEVLKRYDVGMVVESGVAYSTPEYQEWRDLLKKKNIPVVMARFGQKLDLGYGAELDIFHPFENFSGVSVKNVHEANVVSRLKYGKISYLLMGDAEAPVEYRLVLESKNPSEQSFLKLASDILKIGHHGSKTSSTEIFLKTVSPDLAVISVGRNNRYGHPNQEVVNRLADLDINVLRTDTTGDIKTETDGIKYMVLK